MVERISGKLRQKWTAVIRWVQIHVPIGLRTVLGLLLVVGGIFGFLPILGFWMIPLGIAVVAIDLKALFSLFGRK